MRLAIKNNILQQTEHCQKKFSCLKNDNSISSELKKIDRHVDCKVLFLNCNEMCKYNMHFGNLNICNCPTRKEIFKKYYK